jgi:hypothetical protein
VEFASGVTAIEVNFGKEGCVVDTGGKFAAGIKQYR